MPGAFPTAPFSPTLSRMSNSKTRAVKKKHRKKQQRIKRKARELRANAKTPAKKDG